MEHTFQPGDVCPECQQLGFSKQLRLFRINLQEQIVKCESDTCLYPYKDDLSATPPQGAGDSYLDELDGCDSFIEQLLQSEPTTTATAAHDMPTLNFDFLTMQPETAPTVTVNVKRKPTIEIQSVQLIKTEEAKEQKPNIVFTQSSESNGAASIKAESQPDMPTLNFDFVNLQPETAPPVTVNVKRKPTIEIQSVQLIKTEHVKQEVKEEKPNIVFTQSSETNNAASIKAESQADMPTLNFDFLTMQPAPAKTVAVNVKRKPTIEIQSVQLIKTEYIKQEVKEEKPNIIFTQSSETNGAASIKVESQANMPKRISRYFAALKANRPPEKLEVRQPNLAKWKHSKLLVVPKNAEKHKDHTRANTLEDVLQVVQKSQNSASSSSSSAL